MNNREADKLEAAGFNLTEWCHEATLWTVTDADSCDCMLEAPMALLMAYLAIDTEAVTLVLSFDYWRMRKDQRKRLRQNNIGVPHRRLPWPEKTVVLSGVGDVDTFHKTFVQAAKQLVALYEEIIGQ